ncbi:hypothetical protein FRC00_003974 [Tulasnella sp. 408]|nr:hypothetical protein FRC00_003974 [Tulasnella sp. 408]
METPAMNKVSHSQQIMSQAPHKTGELAKALMENALFLQARDALGGGRSAEEVQSILKDLLPIGSPEFVLIPVAPVGSHTVLDRYLLVWCKRSNSNQACHPQAADSTSAAAKAIYEAASKGILEFAIDEMKRRRRDKITVWVDDWARERQGEPLEHMPYPTLLEAVRYVLGQPAHRDVALQNTQQVGLTDTHNSLNGKKRDMEKRKWSDEDGEDGRAALLPDAGAGSKKRARTDPSGARRGTMLEMEDMDWIMNALPRDNETKGSETGVKLAPPPPGHRKTSILKPVPAKEPACPPEPPKAFSPLEYQTNVGDATVVHNIYLEARRGTRPRTPAEERSRRKRALKMAYKEIIRVINDIEWYRKGLGLGSGVRPSALIGLENVPEEEQRPWLLQRLDMLKDRQCRVRCALAENQEARLHIIAVMDAVLDARRAGAEGIAF